MAYYGDNEVLFSPTVNTTVDLTLEIDEHSTNDECPSAKAVYDFGQFINSGSDPIVNIKTGEVITTNDSGHKPLHGLNIYGKTTQAGTPTPDAPIPMVSVGESGAFEVGVYEKNLLPYPFLNSSGTSYTSNGLTYVVDENGIITVNGTSTDKSIYYISKYLPATNYDRYICGCSLPQGLIVTVYYGGKWAAVTSPQKSLLIPAGTMISEIYIEIASEKTFTNSQVKVMITTQPDFDYEPYKGKQSLEVPYTLRGIPVQSVGNYTDANGQQWVCDEVDFENARFIQRIKKIVFNGTENWQKHNYGFILYSWDITRTLHYCKCDQYPPIYWTNLPNCDYGISASDNSSPFICIHDKDCSTVEEFKAKLASNKPTVYYILAQPELYSFQYSAGVAGMYCPLIDAYEALHTNKPNTTIISADNAGQRVAYVADPKLYIDNKFTELQQAIITLGGV